MPPDVPATVSASVPDVVIGDPATDIRPPVKDCATLVTVPPPVAAMVIEPAPGVIVMFVPAVKLALVSVLPVVLPISSWPLV